MLVSRCEQIYAIHIRLAGDFFVRAECHASEDEPEGGRYRARFHRLRKEQYQRQRDQAVRLSRQEECDSGVLPRRIYRWLNEGTYRLPVWYWQIHRKRYAGAGDQHGFYSDSGALVERTW